MDSHRVESRSELARFLVGVGFSRIPVLFYDTLHLPQGIPKLIGLDLYPP
jgi:hypothetical protein